MIAAMATARATALPSGRPRLRVATRSGSVRLVAEERADFLFETRKPWIVDVRVDGDGVVWPELDRDSRSLEVRCPRGTGVVVGTASGSVALEGEFGHVSVSTESGTIRLDRAESADLRSSSGSIEVEGCGERCRVSTQSGKAVIGAAGATEVDTVSGSIVLEGAAGGVRARSASGSVEVRTTGKHDVAVETLSGKVRVRVPTEVKPAAALKSLSGRRVFDCEAGSDCCVAVRTMSGSIEVIPD